MFSTVLLTVLTKRTKYPTVIEALRLCESCVTIVERHSQFQLLHFVHSVPGQVHDCGLIAFESTNVGDSITGPFGRGVLSH